MRIDGWVLYPLHISVKASCQKKGETVTRRVRLENPTYERMLSIMQGWAGSTQPSIFYQDDKEDWIRIGSYLEWQECVRQFLQKGTDVPVKLFIRKPKKTRKPVGILEVPEEHVALDDRWCGIEQVLKAQLGQDIFEKISRGEPMCCSWVNVAGGALLISKRMLKMFVVQVSPGAQTTRGDPLTVAPPRDNEVASTVATACGTEEEARMVDAMVGQEYKDTGIDAMYAAPTSTASTATLSQCTTTTSTNTSTTIVTTSTNTVASPGVTKGTNTVHAISTASTNTVKNTSSSMSTNTAPANPLTTTSTNTPTSVTASTNTRTVETRAKAQFVDVELHEDGDEYESDTFEDDDTPDTSKGKADTEELPTGSDTDSASDDDDTSCTDVDPDDVVDKSAKAQDASSDYSELLAQVRATVPTGARDEDIIALLKETNGNIGMTTCALLDSF